MRLKILFVPVAFILILILIILYIKPDYSIVQAKRVEVAQKEEQVASLDTVIGNVSSLESELNAKRESEEFIQRYFPKELDSDRIVDAVNFISEQTGVALSTINITQSEAITEEALFPVNPAALTSINPALSGDGTGEAALAPMPEELLAAPIPQQAIIRISAEGTYGNLKQFVGRVSHMDRTNSFKSIQMEEKVIEGEGQGGIDPANPLLSGSFEIWMDFSPTKTIESAINVSTFQSAQYNTAPLEKLRTWITNPLPNLEKMPGGKSNPFQG